MVSEHPETTGMTPRVIRSKITRLREFVFVSVILLCMTPGAWANERQERRIESLELENSALRGQVIRLQEQLRQMQMRQSYSPYSYGSGYNSGLSEATRSMQQLEQLRRSWDNLKR